MSKGKWVVRKKVANSASNLLTEQVVGHILKDGWSASRINTTGIWVEEKQCFISGGGRNGFSDVCACIKGRAVAIEIKIGDDEPNKDQLDFAIEWVNAGGIYLIIKTEEQFLFNYNFLLKNI